MIAPLPEQFEALGFTAAAITDAITWGFMLVFGFWLLGYACGVVLAVVKRL